MKKKVKEKENHKEQKNLRFIEAEKSYRKLQEEISPFIKRRVFKEYSTAGEWCETSVLCIESINLT